MHIQQLDYSFREHQRRLSRTTWTPVRCGLSNRRFIISSHHCSLEKDASVVLHFIISHSFFFCLVPKRSETVVSCSIFLSGKRNVRMFSHHRNSGSTTKYLELEADEMTNNQSVAAERLFNLEICDLVTSHTTNDSLLTPQVFFFKKCFCSSTSQNIPDFGTQHFSTMETADISKFHRVGGHPNNAAFQCDVLDHWIIPLWAMLEFNRSSQRCLLIYCYQQQRPDVPFCIPRSASVSLTRSAFICRDWQLLLRRDALTSPSAIKGIIHQEAFEIYKYSQRSST